MTLFTVVQAIVVVVALSFCGIGAVVSVRRRRREGLRAQAYRDVATLVLDGGEALDQVSTALARLEPTLLAEVLQPLAADLRGDALRRIRVVFEHAGGRRRIERLARRRSWKARVRAAHLLALLPENAPERAALLGDRNSFVRARAIESLSSEQIDHFSTELIEALDHADIVVRSAAQHSLSLGGPVTVGVIAQWLADHAHRDSAVEQTLLLVEVAAEIPDVRLVEPMLLLAEHREARLRELTAACLGLGVLSGAEEPLEALLRDEDPTVRAQAVASVGAGSVLALATAVGRLLGDRHWQVRRAAGAALASLGPVGQVVLRTQLDSTDPFAVDMAQHILGQVEGPITSSSSTHQVAA